MIMPLRVRDFMSTRLYTVGPDEDIMLAVERLVSLNLSGLLVVARGGALLGLLTERDCIEVALQAGYFDELAGPVADFMSSGPVTVDVDDSLMDVAQRFAREPYRRYPVLDGERLVGLIARRDVLRALISGAWFPRPAPHSRSQP